MSTTIAYLMGQTVAARLQAWDLLDGPEQALEWFAKNEDYHLNAEDRLHFRNGVADFQAGKIIDPEQP